MPAGESICRVMYCGKITLVESQPRLMPTGPIADRLREELLGLLVASSPWRNASDIVGFTGNRLMRRLSGSVGALQHAKLPTERYYTNTEMQ